MVAPVWAVVRIPHSFGEGLTALPGELIQAEPEQLGAWGGRLRAATQEEAAGAAACPTCGRFFLNKVALLAHREEAHADPKPESEQEKLQRDRAATVALPDKES